MELRLATCSLIFVRCFSLSSSLRNFEEASEVEHLQVERAKFLAHPHVPEELDVSERARYVAEETANFDARIAQVFEEQTRILVMFQLLINIGAAALAKQNRARVKDFLRKYFAR